MASKGSVRDLLGTELFSISTHGCQCTGCDTVVVLEDVTMGETGQRAHELFSRISYRFM